MGASRAPRDLLLLCAFLPTIISNVYAFARSTPPPSHQFPKLPPPNFSKSPPHPSRQKDLRSAPPTSAPNPRFLPPPPPPKYFSPKNAATDTAKFPPALDSIPPSIGSVLHAPAFP